MTIIIFIFISRTFLTLFALGLKHKGNITPVFQDGQNGLVEMP